MTTQPLSASETATSYAAALASGSSKSSTTKIDPPASTMPSINGASEPVTGSSTPRPAPGVSRQKAAGGSSSAPEVSRQPTPANGSVNGSKYDDEGAAHEEKSNGWEGNSQASSHPDSKSSGADTARSSDYVLPPVNVWKKRQEEAAKKSASPVAPSSVSPGPAGAPKALSPEKNFKKSVDEKAEPRDHRKNSDDVPVKRNSRRAQTNENEASVSLPPPVTDTMSWPTPDLAQGEFKKEKEDKERERLAPPPGRGGSKNWVPVAIETPYVPPIQTKSGRGGRGGRGGREGGRGGSSGDRAERVAGPGPGVSGAQEGERGRQYSTSRGGYQGKAKRSSSAGGTAQRRESKAGMVNGAGERRKEGEAWNSESSVSGTASSATQTERSRPARVGDDESAYAGAQRRQYSDGQEKPTGHGYSSRADKQWYGGRTESDSAGTYTPRERGSERGRGGFRGRGNFHSQFSNGHHNPAFQGHPGSAAPPFAGQAPNGHQYPHAHPRGGSYRGRGHSTYGTHPYRMNPAMQPPPAQYAYAGAPYEYAMMPQIDFAALIHQINYYFSVDNLCKDMYLRKHMDNDGYVRLSFLMGFHRVQLHTKDINVLRDACLSSHEIQLTYGVDDMYVRKKDGWENWVLQEAARDESAKRGMSDWHFDPRQRQHNGATMTPPGEMSGSAEPFFPGAPTMAPQFYPQAINTSYGYPAQPTTLSAAVPEFSPSSHFPQHGLDAPFNPSVPRHATDEVPDTHFDSVMVVSQPQRPSTRDGAPVSFEPSPSGQPNGAPIVNGDGPHDESGKAPQVNGNVADQKHRSYTEVRAQAIKYRESGGQGKNNDLITLYRFWSHCLVKTFNTNIYREFKQLALQDADMSVRYGVEQIFKMYEMSFKDRSTIGYDVIRDFVDLVKTEARHGEQFGLEKLKSILANPGLKEDYKSAIDSLLDDQLRGYLHNASKKAPSPEAYKASAMAA
ncbi:hypothetical protein FN846DRAFT_635728 [Sphaerosporella brunnea]|uniref:HTH La-type RNA-binding domain-containing protein n=1 Tax=Sphaerosporella brunnea TaxID=1250544 RepID=A0A5J5EBY5_9PEZI|nr:hypothetical protein FN846DRAFT_635728 [Sphaerosporella brunnea]